ncbi:B12-binding domain-containing radical SAM protein [Syntrophotalea acetylenica]|uniref:Uncharacterized protein n=1 Tax=Syntrophotalea acetylenica TaxID=29542 RepID=A0A1L3GGN5_SYNAC|nr:radical SAM protein [Syntrophotalea acetylenica]APG25106.1 hypothetical protein A7E75_08805 [Syntrophotalea acetylenica]APG43175.1 hypothetical protein A6070_02780 [Syntrophotalea acetylenica]
MNLTLVSMHIEPSSRAVPLASGMLAAALRQAFPLGLTTCLIDFFLMQESAECAELVLEQAPDVVGLSVYTWNRDKLLELAGALKTFQPGVVIFAGGPEVTADPSVIAGHPAIDFVLPGEGERRVVEVLHLLQQGEEPLQVGEWPDAGTVEDLASLPSPFLTGVLPPERYPGLLWELSRGCPFHCDFCFESRGSDRVRRFPEQRLRAELELFATAGVQQLFVLDPTFNFDAQRAKNLLRMMAQVAPHIHYTLEVRAEFIDEEMAGLFADINCALQIGLQSADPAVLARVHRHIDPADFAERILLLHEAGVVYGFDLIYGLPGDSLQGFLSSLDFALGLRPNHLDIFPLAVLPGTRLADNARNLGLEYQTCPPYRLVSSPTFSAGDMARAGYIAGVCDLFYNRGRAVPWFDLILENLEINAARFFERLADELPEEEPVGEALIAWQQQVLREMFLSQDKPLAADLAADVVAWFGFAAALQCQELVPGPVPDDPGRLYLIPEGRFVRFGRDPEALLEKLEMGVTDFDVVAMLVPEQPCEALLYLHQGEVALGVFTPRECAWLQSLADGGCRPQDDALAEFCDAALAEGVVRKS